MVEVCPINPLSKGNSTSQVCVIDPIMSHNLCTKARSNIFAPRLQVAEAPAGVGVEVVLAALAEAVAEALAEALAEARMAMAGTLKTMPLVRCLACSAQLKRSLIGDVPFILGTTQPGQPFRALSMKSNSPRA